MGSVPFINKGKHIFPCEKSFLFLCKLFQLSLESLKLFGPEFMYKRDEDASLASVTVVCDYCFEVIDGANHLGSNYVQRIEFRRELSLKLVTINDKDYGRIFQLSFIVQLMGGKYHRERLSTALPVPDKPVLFVIFAIQCIHYSVIYLVCRTILHIAGQHFCGVAEPDPEEEKVLYDFQQPFWRKH